MNFFSIDEGLLFLVLDVVLALSFAVIIVLLVRIYRLKNQIRQNVNDAAAQRYYEDMFYHNTAPKMLIDPDTGDIVNANPAALNFYGYSLEEIQKLKITDINILPPTEVKAEMENARRELRKYFRFKHRTATGEIRDVRVYSGPITLNEKSYLYSIILDTTKEQEYLRNLKEERKRLADIIWSTGSGTWEWNAQTEELRINERWAEIIGHTKAELEPVSLATWTERVPPDELKGAFSVLEKHFKGETNSFETEMRIRHKDGHYVWILSRGHILTRTPDGKPEWTSGIVLDITARKENEERVASSEKRYKSLIGSMAEGVVVQNQDGAIIECNSQAEKILGLTREQMMGRTSVDPRWKAVHQDGSDYPGNEHPLPVTLRTGRPQRNIIHGIHQPDGTLRWLLVNADPLFRSGELKPYSAVATFTDITDLKQTRDRLTRSKDKYQRLVNEIGDNFVVYAHDLQGILTYASKGVRTIFGIDSSAITGQQFDIVINWTPESAKLAWERIKYMVETGEPSETYELQFIDNNKAIRTLQITAHPSRDESGEYTLIEGIAEDITERKKTEELLEQNERRLNLLLELSQKSGQMSEEQILKQGLKDTEKLTRSKLSYIHFISEDQKCIHEGYWSYSDLADYEVHTGLKCPVKDAGQWADSIRNRRPVIHTNYRMSQNKTELLKGTVTFSNHMSVSISENGLTCFILGVAGKAEPYEQDDLNQLQSIANDLWQIISRRRTEIELEEAKKKAEEANQAKSSFLASMSHEVRTPLNPIINLTRLLSETDLNEEQAGYVHNVLRSAELLSALLNDILDLAKMEAGKFDLSPVHFNLESDLDQIHSMLATQADEKQLQMKLNIAPDVPKFLYGDALRLKQVLVNLLTNSLKFTQKGYVEVQTELQSESNDQVTLHFSVKDTGIGISEEKIKRLFQAFSQADPTIVRKYGGSGMGLVICQKLVQLMGGTIGVESQENVGSTFWFTATFEKSEVQDLNTQLSETKREQEAAEGSGPLHILVAEDNKVNQLVVKALLEKEKHTVDMAENGIEAIEKFRNNTYDVILMDIEMPQMNGIEASDRIRKTQKGKDIPIIALTAHVLKDVRAQLNSAGFDGFIAKPIEPDDLYRKLELKLNKPVKR